MIGVGADGKVCFIEDKHPEPLARGGELTLRSGPPVSLTGVQIVQLPPRAFVCPGFVDTHTHAPQFAFAGLGYDLQLLEWLQTYTFPSEAKFADLKYAASVCGNAVRRTLQAGTTSCVYFGTLHTDAAVLLGRTAQAHGQRAFVGKVNMDRNAPDTYRETTAESIRETERFIELMAMAAGAGGGKGGGKGGGGAPEAVTGAGALLGPPPVPVITPRFVPTCTSELMHALGDAARRHGGLLIQSHVSENTGEIAWVRELHPEAGSYTGVYDAHGLLGPRTILAHGVYLEPAERQLLKARGATVSHCPMSNSMLRSGMLNVRRLVDEGVHVALGTDVSGGASPSMLSAIREALKISNMVSVYEKGDEDEDAGPRPGPVYAPLSYPEAFWLATVGGAMALGVDGLSGDFRDGAFFDALIVDPDAAGSPIDLYEGEAELEAFQKWLMLGDDRNTAAVYVQGKRVWAPQASSSDDSGGSSPM